MADNDILIQIRTALESGGLDAAKAKLNELTSATEGAKGAAAGHARDLAATNQAMRQASAGAQGFANILRGNVTAGLNMLRSSLTGAAGALGAIGASFVVGWKIGSIIRENLIDPLLKANPVIDRTGENLRKARHEAEKLEKTNLENLRKELDETEKSTAKLLSTSEKVARQGERLRGAQEAAEVAAVEASMPEGPARQRKIAEIRKRYGEAGARAEETGQEERAKILGAEMQKLLGERLTLQEQIPTARFPKPMEEELKKVNERIGELSTAIMDIEAEGAVTKVGKGTTASQYKIAMSAATAAEDEERRKKVEEGKRRDLEHWRKTQREEYEAKKSGLEGELSEAKSVAGAAERASEKFAPDPRLRGAKAKAQQTRDENLAQMAADSAARVKVLEATMRLLEEENKQQVEAIRKFAENMKQRDKNLPID